MCSVSVISKLKGILLSVIFIAFLLQSLHAHTASDIIQDTAVSSPISINSKDIVSRITLSSTEKLWLKKNQKVRARVALFPPFHSWDEGPQGISVDYLRLICEGYQLNCEFVTGIPWSQAIGNLQSAKDIDLLLTIKRTPERARQVSFSADYLLLPWVIFSRTNAQVITNIQNLSGKLVSIEDGYLMHKLLEKEYPEIKLQVVKNSKEALEALAYGQVDAYIGNLTVGVYLINKWGFSNVKVAAPVPSSFGEHTQAMAIRPDWPELVSIIDRFISAMTPGEHAAITNRWLSIRYEYGIDWPYVWQLLGIIVGFTLLILLIFANWNRRLRVEVEKRIEAEYQEMRSKEVLQCIYNLQTQFIKETDTFVLFHNFMEELLKLTHSEYGLVGDVLLDEDGNQYLKAYALSNLSWYADTRKLYDEYLNKGLELRKLDNLLGLAITSGQSIISNNPNDDSRDVGFPEGHPHISSFLAIPIFYGEQMVGLIGLANSPDGYDQTILDWVKPIISALGQIIVARWDREARHIAEDELQELATTDLLTGIANRRQFYTQMNMHIKRIARYPEELTLIMLDIDHFKAVNDNYGHKAGDIILIELVDELASKVRQTDLLVRWGGEEFIIIMPHTSVETGKHLAERIRHHVEEHLFREPQHLTISIGLTSLQPEDSLESFIMRADDALYQAKNSGRNLVVVK